MCLHLRVSRKTPIHGTPLARAQPVRAGINVISNEWEFRLCALIAIYIYRPTLPRTSKSRARGAVEGNTGKSSRRRVRRGDGRMLRCNVESSIDVLAKFVCRLSTRVDAPADTRFDLHAVLLKH